MTTSGLALSIAAISFPAALTRSGVSLIAIVLFAVETESRRLSTTIRRMSAVSLRSALLSGNVWMISSSYSWRFAGVSGITVTVRGAVTWKKLRVLAEMACSAPSSD